MNERWLFFGFGAVLGLAVGIVATGAALDADAADMGSLAAWATALFVAAGFATVVALLLVAREQDRRPLTVETQAVGDDVVVVLRNRGRGAEQFARLGLEVDRATSPADPYATGDTAHLPARGSFVQPRTSLEWRFARQHLRTIRAHDPQLRDTESEPASPRSARVFVVDGVGNRYDARDPIVLPALEP